MGVMSGEAVELPAGSYTVRILSSPPRVFEEVRIVEEQELVLKVTAE